MWVAKVKLALLNQGHQRCATWVAKGRCHPASQAIVVKGSNAFAAEIAGK